MSSTDGSIGTPKAPVAADAVAVLRTCHNRALEREGIAMFVALVDLRPDRAAQAPEPAVLEEGRQLADLFGHYFAELEAAGFPNFYPSDHPDETGTAEVIDALVILGEQHLRAQPEAS